MRKGLLFFTGLWLLLQSLAFGQGCIRALTDAGQEADIICVGDNITFIDCGPNPSPTTTYYDADHRNPDDYKLAGVKHQYTASQAGTATVTQNVNPVGGGSGIITTKQYLIIIPIQPAFSVTLCGSNRVEVLLTDQNFRSYTIAWGDGNSEPVTPNTLKTHTYANAGTSYTIKITGHDMIVSEPYLPANPRISCEQSRSQTITTLPQVLQPALTAITLQNYRQSGRLLVSFTNAQPEYTYVLEQENTSGGFDSVTTLQPATAGNFTAITNTTLPQCYRIRVTDNCGTRNLSFSGNTICTVPLSVQASDRKNLLWWPVYRHSGLTGYEITRNNTLIASPTITQTANLLEFSDTTVTCGTNYTYQVKALLASNVVSTSNDSTVVATATTPPAAPVLQVSFNNNNEAELYVTPPARATVQEVTFNRHRPGSAPVTIGQSPQLTFTDARLPDNSQPPCYQVFFRDNCDLRSENSKLVCPVIISGTLTQATLTSPASATLQWTAYNGFGQAPVYELEKITATGTPVSLFSGQATSFTDNNIDPDYQLANYRVKVSDPVTSEVVYSNTLTLAQKFEIHIPNAFSPNNDGLNDVFEVKGRFIVGFSMRIVDRWGTVIFESNDPAKGWDGNINGKPAPVGAYGYSIKAFDLTGGNLSKNGTVTIVK